MRIPYLAGIPFPSTGHPDPIRGCAISGFSGRDTHKVLIDQCVVCNIAKDSYRGHGSLIQFEKLLDDSAKHAQDYSRGHGQLIQGEKAVGQ